MTTDDTMRSDTINVKENKIWVSMVSIDASRIPAKELTLILDTGAFITLIDKDQADLNGYKIFEKESCLISGFSERGLLCDLRIIPTVLFCGHNLADVLVAAPCDRKVKVSGVLGMNILENFDISISLTNSELSVRKRTDFSSQKPRYSCGLVSVL